MPGPPTYSSRGTGGGGGGVPMPLYETFTGPGSSVTLGASPLLVLVLKDGVEQHDDGVGTTEGNYKLAGSTLTVAMATTNVLDVYEWITTAPTVETFTGPGTGVVLSSAPSIVLVFKDGVQQHNDGVGTTEGNFKLAGTNVTIVMATTNIVDVYEWP